MFILTCYIDLVISLSKDGQANENSPAEACISFTRDFATDFAINTRAMVLINSAEVLEEGKMCCY